MPNLFDDPNGRFFVVVNTEGQYSLWPEFAQVPAGWTVSHGAADRSSCLDFINANWTDMRPLSLVAHLAETASYEKEATR
ncbi:MbtH family protein [Streptomyces lunaelactis]|uniref:MbtH family protein n=1 Tax=Streptomyces lunaelactis TaxID=1535768 RepID=UPI001584ABD4|nr:MbtH family protein [Streptomyces lunaelactis]NUK00331.1 MbtH family protein [Streptomyces lunaelactis]NUK14927.1 MbtH family protein [Streptomyces lunaelactis]NUK22120.1 MbtH family protein [Streptomyces lunaelactis]NUK34256.1 MbtH family protein [Streptomyces lunaelactis]NUK40528.1 MbtH family protein [Streptomyces lunaelactis]